jgi:hypothetical protein
MIERIKFSSGFTSVSVEGPADLDNDLKDLIIESWKSKK